MLQHIYDLIVIGGGAAGLTAAKLAHGLGKKVLLIEKNKLGGECTWTGCIPSKTLIAKAHALYSARSLHNEGLSLSGTLDSTKIMNHIRDTVQTIYNRETPDDLQKIGIHYTQGTASFLDNQTILCNTTKISAKKFIIATGSSPTIPPIEGIDTVSYLTNTTLFNLKKLPNSMIIIGGGAIGSEMASALHRLGVAITLVESQQKILAQEDQELVTLLTDHFISEGITIKTGIHVIKTSQRDTTITVTCKDESGRLHELHAESLLIAVGRKPNNTDLDLKKAGVEIHTKGIQVTSTLQTTAPTIYACGDVVGPYQFSHMANYQAQIAVRNAYIPFFKKHVDYTNIAWVTFTLPELAHAGMTQEQAQLHHGNSIKIYRAHYADLDRAVVDNQTFGMAKFICTKQGYLLGAQILGNRAGELIHEVQVGKKFSIKFSKFFSTIHAYPTYSELIWHAAKKSYIDELRNNFFIKLFQKIIK